jgi:hypothetical protein
MFVNNTADIFTKILDGFTVVKKSEYLSVLIALKELSEENIDLKQYFTIKQIEKRIPSDSDFIQFMNNSGSDFVGKKLNSFLNTLLKYGVVYRTYIQKGRSAFWKFNENFLREHNLLENSNLITLGKREEGISMLPINFPTPSLEEKESVENSFKVMTDVMTDVIANITAKRTENHSKFAPSTHKTTTIPPKAIEPKNPVVVTKVDITKTPNLPEVKRIKERPLVFPTFNKTQTNFVEIPYFCSYRLIRKNKEGTKQKTFSGIFTFPEDFFYQDEALTLVEEDIKIKHFDLDFTNVLILNLNPLVIV